MNELRTALTRKFGPLPAWAWGAILLAVVLSYRKLSGQYAAGATTDASSGTGDLPDPAEPRETTTLDPGQSLYDPNTGALVSTAPEQQPSEGDGAGSEPQRPITLKPGQGVYDPNTGRFVTFPHPKPPKKRRKPKPKPHHKPGKHPKHPTHGKKKPRGHGLVQRVKRRKKHAGGAQAPSGRDRRHVHPRVSSGGYARLRSPAAPRTGAMRQRPEARHPKARPDAHAHPRSTRRHHKHG